MIRVMFVLSGLSFLGMVFFFVTGLGSGATALIALSLFVLGPSFFFSLGFAVGRFTQEFRVERRDSVGYVPTTNTRARSRRYEPDIVN